MVANDIVSTVVETTAQLSDWNFYFWNIERSDHIPL